MIFEIFTESSDEDAAYYLLSDIKSDQLQVAKNALRNILGERGVSTLKKIIKK
jgi:hypothetical protein